MAGEFNLKYLHPSVKTYITTDNYQYDTSVSREVLFVADVFEHGKDNVLQEVNTVSEYLFKYGDPDYDRFGQAGYNIEKWLTSGNTAIIMRLLPEDASYAHAVFNVQYKNATNAKTVINSEGEDVKINDVYLRPLVTYIGVNNTSEKLLDSELSEDRSDYPTTDGYVDNFLFEVYPEGRGEYYNDLGFRIRLNTAYDGNTNSRIYTFEVIKYSGTSYDIVDGPYYVSFDPDELDPNTHKSMFIENVVNSYSDYVKIKFNTENYIKLASIINDEVNPYILDVITGQSRIMEDGNRETFLSKKTGKDEDVHVSIIKYSTTGVALKSGEDYILNIENNDETTKDIVDIADNARKVIYTNQKYVTEYMRGFYNWLLQNRIEINLNKIINGSVENSFDPKNGILAKKVYNLIFANDRDSDPYYYIRNGIRRDSRYVGKNEENEGAWYLRTQEIVDPDLKNKNGLPVGTKTTTGYEGVDSTYISSSQVVNTITEDGYIEKTKQHLISYYHNFKKYMQYIINYDLYNNTGFVPAAAYLPIENYYDNIIDSSAAPIYAKLISNNKTDQYTKLVHKNNDTDEILTVGSFDGGYNREAEYIFKNINYETKGLTDNNFTAAGTGSNAAKFSYFKNTNVENLLIPTYIDDNTDIPQYIPITNLRTYDEAGNAVKYGTFIKVQNALGEEILQPISGCTLTLGKSAEIDASIVDNMLETYLYKPEGGFKYRFKVFNKNKNDDDNQFVTVSLTGEAINIDIDKTNTITAISLTSKTPFYELYIILKEIYKKFDDYNINNYIAVFDPSGTGTAAANPPKNYNEYNNNKNTKYYRYSSFELINFIKFFNALFMSEINIPNADGEIVFPKDYSSVSDVSTINKYNMLNIPVSTFNLPTTDSDGTGALTIVQQPISKVNLNLFVNANDVNSAKFDPVFDERTKPALLAQSFNKIYAYANLISKELDGKGEDTILEDIQKSTNIENLDYSDYSLTTIINLLIGGFESIVNNMGSITDYTNYSLLKYLLKTIRNKLDLRSTYLTLLSLHKNKILDLSILLAKNNASVILGDETLDLLYGAMDDIVVETNYLINIINTLIYRTYTIYNVTSFKKVIDNKPYAYYFKDLQGNEVQSNIDPLGIINNLSQIGTDLDTQFHGILPILETILIDITGENHLGDARVTMYGGSPLIEVYDDIKNGYLIGGLTQERYESIYQVLSKSLDNLTTVHKVITSFINDKYISEIVDTLLGTIDVNNAIIKYKGSTYSINSLWELYNSGIDEDLTQIKVIDLINEALEIDQDEQPLPIDKALMDNTSPIMAYCNFCIADIKDSVVSAKQNKKIVQQNIIKQDHVLSSLNTLCYDNFVTDVTMPIGFAEGSDGSFTYDNSTNTALKIRENKINDIRIKAYKGTWNEDVINKDLYEFDHVIDANYPDAVKNAIVTLARDERQDFFFWADTTIQNTVQDTINWKERFTNSTYFMSILSQSQVWYDEYTSKNITLTSTYLIADMLGRHIDSFGRHYPMAGSRRGVVGGFTSCDWYPNEEQKEKLYKNKVNYIERDPSVIRIGAQNTNYPSGPLGQINNMLVLLRIKRVVEKIAKTYQFEFNTNETRNKMETEINNYLKTWINNGACTLAKSTVYASDYDIAQKIVRVDITLKFTGVIERIVITIDCPAS